MAFHEKKSFAKLCGLTTGNLTNYIKRGKVVLSGDYIDDDVKVNAEFLEYRIEFIASKNIDAPTTTSEKKETPKIETPKNKILSGPNKKDKKEPAEADTKLAELNRRKAQAELEKKTIDTKLAKLKYQQNIGAFIPTELVSALISHLGKSFMTTYKEGADVFLNEVSHRASMSSKDTAKCKGELIKLVNKAHEKALRHSKTQIKNILLDFTNITSDEAE